VRFLVAPLVAAADEVADDAITTLQQAGHDVTVLDAAALRDQLGKLADPASASTAHTRTYLSLFGMDAASAVLGVTDPTTFRTGLNDLQTVLHTGPAYGIHLLGWWRGLRRLQDDIGGSFNRDDIACLVALNVSANELGMYLSEIDLNYEPRPNRALLVDLHDQRRTLIVPFTHPDRLTEEA
jgi:DNA segregation ATPase FtsK/SpoIIIE, S-DNA-T family